MLRQLIASIAVSGALVQASTGTAFEAVTQSACSSLWGSGGTVPMALPTSTTVSTVGSVVTEKEVTVLATTRVKAPQVTTTVSQAEDWIYTESTSTVSESTRWHYVQTFFATATIHDKVCTNNVKPSTVTEYSGTYVPVSGQVTTVPASYPTEVVCETGVTVFTHLLPTATSGITTVTDTPTSTVYAVTTTVTHTYTTGTVVYQTTVDATLTQNSIASVVVTTSTACEATTTTTYAAKCAPTNVISGVDGYGLVSGKYAGDSAIVYIKDDSYDDPSLCCQLCVDNEGCAGMMAGGLEYCGLLYVRASEGGPACGAFIYSYQSQTDVFPGQDLWVQSGCGEIEYTGPDGF